MLFSIVMFSPTSFAEWTKVDKNVVGDTYYVDFEKIKKVNGYVYYWVLHDFLKPNKWGELSFKTYIQSDWKVLLEWRNDKLFQKN